jgi:hypothetical protein
MVAQDHSRKSSGASLTIIVIVNVIVAAADSMANGNHPWCLRLFPLLTIDDVRASGRQIDFSVWFGVQISLEAPSIAVGSQHGRGNWWIGYLSSLFGDAIGQFLTL